MRSGRAVLALAGWLVPGGAYLLRRRYGLFALSLLVVLGAFSAGLALHGGTLWPAPGELQGLDPLAAAMARAGAAARLLAGGPWMLAHLFHYSQSYAGACLNEYGTTLLTLAGLVNLLALADALELRKAER